MEVIGAEKLAEAGNVSGVDARRTLADHALDEARSVVKVGGFVAGGDVAQNEQVLNYAASGVVDGIRRTQALNRNTLDQAIAVAMQNRASNDPDGKAAVDSMIEKINQQL